MVLGSGGGGARTETGRKRVKKEKEKGRKVIPPEYQIPIYQVTKKKRKRVKKEKNVPQPPKPISCSSLYFPPKVYSIVDTLFIFDRQLQSPNQTMDV